MLTIRFRGVAFRFNPAWPQFKEEALMLSKAPWNCGCGVLALVNDARPSRRLKAFWGMPPQDKSSTGSIELCNIVGSGVAIAP